MSAMLLLKNGALIDGTGSPERSGDVYLQGGSRGRHDRSAGCMPCHPIVPG
jgi:hypothetical protein